MIKALTEYGCVKRINCYIFVFKGVLMWYNSYITVQHPFILKQGMLNGMSPAEHMALYGSGEGAEA